MRNKTWLLLAPALALLGGFLVGWACKPKTEVDENKVVARVGDAVLTADDVVRLDEEQKRAALSVKLTRPELMDSWIQSELIYRAALKQKLDEEKDTAWRLYNTRKAILLQRYWEVNVQNKYPEASDADALAYYDDVKDEQYKAKYEGVWTRRMMFNSREKADEAYARLKAGEDFGTVAGALSAAPEKAEGGNLGYRRLSDISPGMQAEIKKIKPGEYGAPFKLATFWVIVKVEDVVPPGGYLKPEGIGMAVLKDKARLRKWDEERARILEGLAKATKVERFPQRIPEVGAAMVPEGPASLRGSAVKK